MSREELNILLIEDHPGYIRLIREMLMEGRMTGFQLESAYRLALGLERLETPGIDIILLDLSLPDSHGLATFHSVQAKAPDVPIVVLSGLEDETRAIQAVQAGAQDYLDKGHTDAELLVRTIRYAVERGRVQREHAQRLAEEQAARAAAVAGLRAYEEFIGRVAQELQSAIASLRPAIPLRLDADAPQDRPIADTSTRLDMIGAVASQLDQLAQSLRALSHIATDPPAIARQPLDLRALVQHVVAHSDPALRQPNRLPTGDEPVMVAGDSAYLAQAVATLLQTVVQHSPRSGSVQVQVARAAGRATIVVSGAEWAIQEATLPRLFERFYRLPGDEASQSTDLGIALYLVKEIVTLHGGQVEVISSEDAGSTFTISLPVFEEAIDPAESYLTSAPDTTSHLASRS